MQPARCGNSSVTSMPLSPWGRAENGEGISPPRLGRFVAAAMACGRWPAYWASIGLGSKVSTCDGPPFMNRKMTRFARAGKCGGRTASGSAGEFAVVAGTPAGQSRLGQHAGESQRTEAAADAAEHVAPRETPCVAAACPIGFLSLMLASP